MALGLRARVATMVHSLAERLPYNGSFDKILSRSIVVTSDSKDEFQSSGVGAGTMIMQNLHSWDSVLCS